MRCFRDDRLSGVLSIYETGSAGICRVGWGDIDFAGIERMRRS